MYKELKIHWANDYKVIFDCVDGDVFVCLQNPNNFIISDKRLTNEEKKAIEEIVSFDLT